MAVVLCSLIFYYCVQEIDVLVLCIPLYINLPEDGDLSLKHVGRYNTNLCMTFNFAM
jgi:hypothetical protein